MQPDIQPTEFPDTSIPYTDTWDVLNEVEQLLQLSDAWKQENPEWDGFQ